MSTATSSLPPWILASGVVGVSFQLIRLSIDAIQTASQSTAKDFVEHDNKANSKASESDKLESKEKSPNYGSVQDTEENGETTHLLASSTRNFESQSKFQAFMAKYPALKLVPSQNKAAVWSVRVQILFSLLIGYNLRAYCVNNATVTDIGVNETRAPASVDDDSAITEAANSVGVIPVKLSICAIAVILLGALLTARDLERRRLGSFSRCLYLGAAAAAFAPMVYAYYTEPRDDSTNNDEFILNSLGLYVLLALAECFFLDLPHQLQQASSEKPKKRTLSRSAILTLLKPYFWPDSTSNSALLNRTRAILTWVCVVLSKCCNLASPLFLGWASTALAHQDYASCVKYACIYATLQFSNVTFREGQSLVYLKVAQAAFVQLAETTFVHLHSLSLDWHLKKKLGEVIRSMDRGIAACDTLMKYLFLWLLPALVECGVVCIIFATYFQYTPLAVSVFYFVWVYVVWTILVTLWRKKFRKAVVRSDNEWHERCTDSLLNFETVKYFTAERYEARRFAESVQRYQEGSVQVQASLSALNISQQLILQCCLAVALSLSAYGIKGRIDCCYDHGCDSGISECCQAIDSQTCPGMQVGDFVAVLSYVLQLFAPLNFLGSLYNAIVMAIVDLTNLSELLAEDPDVVDAKDAIPLPPINEDDPDIAVEFDNVVFHYPTQPPEKGLKGLSFKMRRGTTTAIVGATGEGKTTVSRLLFRFYDVLGGAVRVNGKDVRILQQQSLRGAIGAVAQSASLFSDTIKANLQYGKLDATQAELEQAAKDAQLLGFIESLDDGWDTLVGDRGLKLSGGERQRASIARCLLKDPPFVLLDEATSALDTLTENSVQQALDRLGTERTVLVIAHRLGTIRNADNIVVLKGGIVAEQGTHDELMAKNGIYAEMWNMQLTSRSGTGSQDSLSAVNE